MLTINKQAKAKMALLITYRVDFRTKVIRDIDGHFIKIQGSVIMMT